MSFSGQISGDPRCFRASLQDFQIFVLWRTSAGFVMPGRSTDSSAPASIFTWASYETTPIGMRKCAALLTNAPRDVAKVPKQAGRREI